MIRLAWTGEMLSNSGVMRSVFTARTSATAAAKRQSGRWFLEHLFDIVIWRTISFQPCVPGIGAVPSPAATAAAASSGRLDFWAGRPVRSTELANAFPIP